MSVAVKDVAGGGDGFGQAFFLGSIVAEDLGDDASHEFGGADDGAVGPITGAAGQVELVFASGLVVNFLGWKQVKQGT